MTPQIVTDAPWLRPETIEAKAQSRLSAYEAEFGEVTAPPVPIEHLIESHLHLRIDWDVINEEGSDVILAYINPGEQKICMNESRRDHFEEYWGTETFTFAHEVGHWDLHVTAVEFEQLSFLDIDKPREFLCRWNKYDRLEWQANRYGAALVMPKEIVVREIEGLDICQWPTLYRLKDRFNVTITAFRKRLEELGLIYVSEDGELYPPQAASCNQLDLM
jgi:Zn-dependent peptidase ImmA (M78 family)